MATTKPRITITLEHDVYTTLRALAELQGRPMASIVSELMLQLHPVQQQVLSVLRKAKTVEVAAQRDFVERMGAAQGKAEQMMLPLLALLEGASEALQPPHSNTGVTTPNPPAKNDKKKTAKPQTARVSAKANTKTQKHGTGGA